jgi:hypothetical protein
MVQFPSLAPRLLWIQRRVTRYSRAGLPHSDIPGSKSARDSPGLIAACYVLHRLPAPRHPPCALSSLTMDSVSYKRTPLMLLCSCYPFSIVKDRASSPFPKEGASLSIFLEHRAVGSRSLPTRRPPGGGKRNRTAGLLLAKQALSQLSYTPMAFRARGPPGQLVGLGRVELPTSPLSGARSSQLSYRP